MSVVKRVMPMVSAIGLRYSAIIIQFGLVVLISRHTTAATAGVYFIIFGWINSTCFLAGFGLPDGLVREVSHHLGTGADAAVYPLIRRASAAFVALTLATVAIGGGVAIGFGLSPTLALLVGLWWLCYATVFYSAQCLVAMGRPTAGSFFFYPALNISLLFTLFPYLLISHAVPIDRLLIAALSGGIPMALAAIVLTTLAVRRFAGGAACGEAPALAPIFSLGIRIAIARVAQTAIYWIPTWIAGAVLAPAAAAMLGLASRLNNAVAAVMAAIRFIVRPQIVAAAAKDDWPTITRNARMIGTLASGGVLIALIVYLAIGRFILVGIFGAAYAPAFLPLAVLMLGTLAEAVGGVVDEVLKMTGNASFVLGALCSVVVGEALFSWIAGSHGLIWLAAAQSLALIALYTCHLSFLAHKRGAVLLPFLSRDAFVDAMGRRRAIS